MTLEELRAKIPTFECKEGCGECCTCHCAFAAEEAARIGTAEMGPADFTCGPLKYWEFCMFLTPDNRCGIYDERPIRCRLFGTVADKDSIYGCPHGCAPEKPLTDEQAQRIALEYEELTKGQPEFHTFGMIDGKLRPIERGDDGQDG